MLWVLLLGTGNDSEVFESGLVYKIVFGQQQSARKAPWLKKKKREISHLTIFSLSDVDFIIIKVADVACLSSN